MKFTRPPECLRDLVKQRAVNTVVNDQPQSDWLSLPWAAKLLRDGLLLVQEHVPSIETCKSYICKAAKSGRVRDNGKQTEERRFEPKSLLKYIDERKDNFLNKVDCDD
jgi:hypothetical protein